MAGSIHNMGFRRGQSAVEYALLLSILAFVFLTMFFYVKNAVRARLLITQDRLNEVRTQ